MNQDQLEHLRDGLLGLSEPAIGPSDPAAGVNQRVRRLRRRRTAGSLAGVAVLTAGVIVASQTLTTTPQSEPPVAGLPGSTPTVTVDIRTGEIIGSTPPGVVALPQFPLPAPWSAKMYTKLPDANAFRPHGYYVVNETKLDGRPWGMVSYQSTDSDRGPGCLEVTPQGVFDPANCFDRHASGARADWRTATATRGMKPDLRPLPYTLVYGVTHFDARSVKVTLANGASYQTTAVGTPTSRSQRFFGVVVPVKDGQIKKVEPLDANGRLAPKLLD